jgi:DNA sulfur modification protein DndD
MTTKIRILGWEANGLRCPDHKIDLSFKEKTPHNISLVQMPNGTGKTTVLDLLRAAMSGGAESWDTDKVARYAKKNGSSTQGRFTLRLLLNDEAMTMVMLFDFDVNRVFYKTTYRAGQEQKFDPPFQYRQFLSEKFVNFYIFDGELAQQLLDKTKTSAETVVDDLFQISALKTLSQRVDEYWEAETKEKTAKKDRGYARRKKRRDNLRDRLDEQLEAQSHFEARREELEDKLRLWNERYSDEVQKHESLSNDLIKAEDEYNSLNNQVKANSKTLLDDMREPHAISGVFAAKIRGLKRGLDRVKLPESAAREFFVELAEEDACICGRPIDEDVKAEILRRSSQYLGSEDVSLLNLIKTAVDESIPEFLDQPEQTLIQQTQSLGDLVEKRQHAKMARDQVRNELESTDPDAKKARDKINAIKGDLDLTLLALNDFSNGKDLGEDQTTDIKLLEEKLETAEHKFAEVTKTLKLKEKRDTLKAILKTAYETAQRDVISEVCKDANTQIGVLMPNNHIRIDTINKSLRLEGQAGGSTGEELSIAYSFLSTLFGRSEHQLPFIVDSPAGPIDLAIRPEIGKLVPLLSEQFIAFTISSERDGFVPSLKSASKTPVQFITLFRKGKNELDTNALLMDQCDETSDGIQVVGEGFFNDFQLDVE